MKLRLLLPLLLAGCAATAPHDEPSSEPVTVPSSAAAYEPPRTVGELRRLATGMRFTEGPVWLADEEALIFSDIPRGELLRWSAADGLTTFRTCANPNGNALTPDGRLLTCQHGARNLVRWEPDGTRVVLADRFEGRRLNSPNDVAVRADGTLWFTDPPWGLERQREGKELDGHFVFRRDTDGRLTLVLRHLAMPNGVALSPDATRLYVADTGGHPSHPDPDVRDRPATVTAWVIGPDDELIPEPLWSVATRCDGMCVDGRGFVFATGKTGLTVLSPSGEIVGTIETPEQPANVCLGGPDGRTLFITARTSLYAIELAPR